MTDASQYRLPVPGDFRRTLTTAWLLLAISALLLSGIFVILIVFSRTPGVDALFPFQDFFHHAIVAHVDFSVLVWFAAIAAMFWSLTTLPRWRGPAWLAFAMVISGSVLMAIAPFRPGEAIMSNYVPVVNNLPFLAGLGSFGAGILVMAVRSLAYPASVGVPLTESGVLRFGVHTSAVILVLAALALVWSLAGMPSWIHGPQYFEALFWGSGHLMQFAWTQLMLVSWLWLAGIAIVRMPLTPRLVLLLLLAGASPAFLAIWAYLAHDVASPQHRQFFIWLMAAGGGVAAGPIGIALFIGWRRSAPVTDMTVRGMRVALLFSIALFGFGGLLGFMIDASNTMVPAHYHGCIVAVTLAFMAIGLHLLPAFGFARPNPRLVLALPWVYGTGQILHVIGLAFSGGHGVQRKTAGAEQGLEGLAQVAGMAVMGLGGLIAIIGGILFLAAVASSIRGRRRAYPLREAVSDA